VLRPPFCTTPCPFCSALPSHVCFLLSACTRTGTHDEHRGEHRVLDVDFLLERYKWFDSDLSRLSRRDKVQSSKRTSKESVPYRP
jgi:hypothetical protein